MKHALKSLTGHKEAQASVVDGKLILSLPHAINPVVWQMDLNETQSSALEVRTDKNAESYTLILKTGDNKVTDIAPFKHRDDAVEGLMMVAKALESAHGQIKNTPNSGEQTHIYTHGGPRKKRGWIPLLLSIVTLLIVFMIWASLSMRIQNTGVSTIGTNSNAASQSAQNVDEPGVAISADEFLSRR